MHVLRELRRRDSRRKVPELRRQPGCPPHPASFRTSPTSGIDAPHLPSGRLREHFQKICGICSSRMMESSLLAEGSNETGR
jgi:hypothetical protein